MDNEDMDAFDDAVPTGMQQAYTDLKAVDRLTVVADERMSRHTSYRIGGPAALFVTCDSYSALRRAVEVLAANDVPWVVLGRGSNVLVSDAGYDGAVLTLGAEFRRFTVDDEARLHAGAGASLQRVVTEAFDRGLAGLEFAVGIPGSVGGAISMNAGTATTWMGGIVEEVVTYRPGTGMVRYGGRDIGWYYRCCDIPGNEIVLEATLALTPGDAAAVKRSMEATLERRKALQPLDGLSCGSVFRNPPGGRASELIGACGLAGYTHGRAQISPKHANFIVNLGGASASDVTSVIAHAMEEVSRVHGIELQPEVKFLGFSS